MSAARTIKRMGNKPADRSALLLLLAYVEAECRRIGAAEAATLAARTALAVEEACGPESHASEVPGPRH